LEPLFDALASTAAPPDAGLPDTGVGLELERRLAPPFVLGEAYGTRCSTIVMVGRHAAVFAERRFGPLGRHAGDSIALMPFAGGDGAGRARSRPRLAAVRARSRGSARVRWPPDPAPSRSDAAGRWCG